MKNLILAFLFMLLGIFFVSFDDEIIFFLSSAICFYFTGYYSSKFLNKNSNE